MVAAAHEESTGARIARNFSLLLTSQLTTFALSMLATIVIPRYLGAAVIGRLQLATAIWALAGAVIGFGMDLAISKAVARDHSVIGQTVVTAIVTRLLLAVPVAAFVFLYAAGIGYGPEVMGLLIILGCSALALTIGTVTDAVLVGIERVGVMSIAAIAGRFVGVGGSVALLMLGYGVFAVAIITGIGTALTTVVQLRTTYRVWQELDGLVPRRPTRQAIINMLAECAPYFWIAFFMIGYQQIDTIVISVVVANDDVLGWYSVYDRLAGMLMFAPVVFMAVMYPTLTRLFGPDQPDQSPVQNSTADNAADGTRITAEHHLVTQRTFRLMVMVSVPAGIGLAVLARPLVTLLYGDEFVNASPVVAVGAIVITLTYLTTVFSMILISMDKQRALTALLALCAALTIPLDMALVPFFDSQLSNGAIGGVAAYAITELIMLSGTIFLLPRGSLDRSSVNFAIRVVACGLVMGAAIYPLRDVNVAVPIGLGVLVFVASGVVFKLVDADDQKALRSVLPSRLGGI